MKDADLAWSGTKTPANRAQSVTGHSKRPDSARQRLPNGLSPGQDTETARGLREVRVLWPFESRVLDKDLLRVSARGVQ